MGKNLLSVGFLIDSVAMILLFMGLRPPFELILFLVSCDRSKNLKGNLGDYGVSMGFD